MSELLSPPTTARHVPAAASARRRDAGGLLLVSHSALIYLFLYAPIAILVLYSFNASTFGTSWEGFTLHWYRSLLRDRRLIQAFTNSLYVAGVSTAIATIIGTMTALAMRGYRFRGRGVYGGPL